MELNIPLVSGDQLQISLNPGERLFMVGANGSGKSALIQHLVSLMPGHNIRRISAHRQTWLHSGSINFTPENRKNYDQNSRNVETRSDARWRDRSAGERQSAVLFDLVAKDDAHARSIRFAIRQVDLKKQEEVLNIARETQESETLFEQLNALLALGTLTVSIENSKGEEILARHGDNGDSFSIAQMSDGERNAVLIATEVLTVEPETVLLIDEPERHLHRSIIEPFLSALFEQRPDCSFVVSTHEVALPVANPEARVLIVRSCDWNGDKADKWDAELLEANIDMPEYLKRDILGARRRILFVEGSSGKLDVSLYSALFPSISVVPKGSCGEVEKAVKGLRESHKLHDVEAFGLIDRDDRSKEKVKELSRQHVFALDVCSVESLYFCSDAIEVIARQQAESLGCDADEIFKEVKQKALGVLNQNNIAEEMAARRLERQVRDSVLSQLPDWKQIKNNHPIDITKFFAFMHNEELKKFKHLVDQEKLDELFARYPLQKSQVLDTIAKSLRFRGRKDYEKTLTTRIRKGDELAHKLKNRIRLLSEALEADAVEAGVS